MSEFEVCHGMHQIAEGLRFLHEEAKVVHGNVCPSSIVLTTSGDWKLCGFGFAHEGLEMEILPKLPCSTKQHAKRTTQ